MWGMCGESLCWPDSTDVVAFSARFGGLLGLPSEARRWGRVLRFDLLYTLNKAIEIEDAADGEV